MRVSSLPSAARASQTALGRTRSELGFSDAVRTLRHPLTAMELRREHVVAILRKAGLPEVAEEAERSLPDPVQLEDAAKFGERYGVTRDELISHVGGSP